MKVIPNGRLTAHTVMFDLKGDLPASVRSAASGGSRTRPFRVVVDWIYSWTSECWVLKSATVMERTATGNVVSKITYNSTKNMPEWALVIVTENEPVTGTAWMKHGGCPDA